MKAMLNETAVHIMGLLMKVVGIWLIQNRQAIFYRRIFLSGLTNKYINLFSSAQSYPYP
jgi:hypothetical protein